MDKVIVTDIKMSFWSMVFFMVKWTVASIPAIVILILMALAGGVVLKGISSGILQIVI